MRRLRLSLRTIFSLQIICFQLLIPSLANSTPCEILETIFEIDCSTFQAEWDGIMDSTLGPPNFTAFPSEGARRFVIVSWASQVANRDLCRLFSITNDKIPDKINFSAIGSQSFPFSSYSYVLIFDCNEQNNTDVQNNADLQSNSSLACSNYKNDCGFVSDTCTIENRPQRFKTLSCSSFTFLDADNFFQSTNLTDFAEWKGATLQISDRTSPMTKKGCNANCKIAIAVSVPVVFIAITLLLVWIYYKRKPYSIRSFRNVSSNRILTERVHALSKKFGPVAAAEFSFAMLSKATNSFADENMIGDGGFGAVYLGVLKTGQKVAVKRLYHDNFKRIEHFYNEIRILSSLNHPNLVKLYGFCCQDERDLLLVFEYAPNGTVFDQLHDPERPPMPWSTRLNIARETAEALCYLHNSVSPPIYHRDVKTSNILLDDELHAKLADFGLSRMVPLEASHVSTVPQGSPGYLDPDYHHCYQLTNKSDVYSFGVVLVELVSAKLAVDISRDRREINLSSMALMKIGCGMWQDLVDPRLEMSEDSQVERTVKQVLELSFLCLNEDKDSRPTIDYVVDTLRRLCKESGFNYHHDNLFSSMLDARHPSPVEDKGRQSIDVKSSSRSRNLTDFSLSSTDSQSSLL